MAKEIWEHTNHRADDGHVRPSPVDVEASLSGLLARAERTVSEAGERLLSNRLHQVLDDGGSAALLSLSESLLPLLQALIDLVPQLLRNGEEAPPSDVVQTLGSALHERSVALSDVLDEGLALHDRLLKEVALHLRENDQALVTAISQVSHALLKVGQGILLAYYQSATALLAEQANTDPLTGLANRRYLETRLAEEILRAQRKQFPLALILLDLDGLKAMNDTFGHACGDQLLCAMARLLRNQSRGIDVAARLGGDEFALLLPETDQPGARALLRRAVESAADHNTRGQQLRFSAGIAIYPDDSRTIEGLLARADAALYEAKIRSRKPSINGQQRESGSVAAPSRDSTLHGPVERE